MIFLNNPSLVSFFSISFFTVFITWPRIKNQCIFRGHTKLIFFLRFCRALSRLDGLSQKPIDLDLSLSRPRQIAFYLPWLRFHLLPSVAWYGIHLVNQTPTNSYFWHSCLLWPCNSSWHYARYATKIKKHHSKKEEMDVDDGSAIVL